MGRAFLSLLRRDITLAMRRRTDVLTTLFFFVIVVSLFPLGVGSEKDVLRQLGPGVVWVAALLASMLALERLFAADYEDGTLEQLLLTRHPLSLLVLAKVTAHWLLTGLPVVLIAPLIGMQYYLPETAIVTMMLALLVGTPVLSLVGAIGSITALDFLGFGLPPLTPSWGELLQQAQQNRTAWWLILYPSLMLFTVMLLTVFIGEGLRDAFDPKPKTRYR